MNRLQSILAAKIEGYIPKIKGIELICLERRLKEFGVGLNKPLELYYKEQCIQSSGFSVSTQGYISAKDKDTSKTAWLHRIVYAVINGSIPDNLLIRHTCHNKACLNPDHLILGTAKDNYDDNVRDGKAVGSAVPGERHHNARLTADQVREIFLYKGGMTGNALSIKYRVDPTTISRIRRQVDWVIVTQDLLGSKFLGKVIKL